MSTQTHPTTRPARLGRRALLAGALALAATASMVFGVGAASAATIPTSVSIQRVERPAQDVFKGTVSASDARCFQNRRVILFRVAPGADTKLDVDRSEDNGKWSIDVEGGAPAGDYYAKAPRKAAGADTCGAAKSATVTVP